MTRGVTKIRHLLKATSKGDTRFGNAPIQKLTMCNDCVNFDSLHEEKSIRPYEKCKNPPKHNMTSSVRKVDNGISSLHVGALQLRFEISNKFQIGRFP